MDSIGLEVLMPALWPMDNRETTGRRHTVDVLMKTSGANELSKNKCTNEYILNPTHEDLVTPLVQQFVSSYKDLPVAVYQIQSKFRNEARAKSGLLRGREFRMKDLYSFHADENDFVRFYEQSKEVYMNVFKELGLADETYITVASGGDFTKRFSHEFQTICDAGEDLIFIDESTGEAWNLEVAPSQASQHSYSDALWLYEDVYGENVVSVAKLCAFLDLEVWQTVKTMLYKDNNTNLYAVAVRGDYEVNEEKLRKALDVSSVELLTDEEIMQYTWAERGYAGIVNLPEAFTLICDDALATMTNMESWTNKTHYHTVNINRWRDLPRPERFYDIKNAKPWDSNPVTGQAYRVEKACEVGNIFPLETKFTDAFAFTHTDNDNKHQKIIMWSYGIWPSRVMGVIVEKYHDEKGIIRPENIAPFTHCIIGIGKQWLQRAAEVYARLQKQWVDVCFDDRAVGPWFKFKDAELIGYPRQIVIWDKTLAQGDMCEVVERKIWKKQIVSIEKYIENL